MDNKETLKKYGDFAKELLYHFNPMRRQQMEIAIAKNFRGVDSETVQRVLHDLQWDRQILKSADGWVISKNKYVELTGDERFANFVRNVNHEYLLPPLEEYIKESCNMKLINCLWVLIDMLPYSMDFVVTNKPFQLGFISGKNKLYEVTYIENDEEDAKLEMLNLLPRDLYPEAKQATRRIVILENEKHADRVPEGIGVRYVLCLDDKTSTHYRVIDDRKDPWNEQQ